VAWTQILGSLVGRSGARPARVKVKSGCRHSRFLDSELPPFHLVRSKEDVLKDIRKQISKGRDIAEYQYDDDEVEDAINKETKWDLLNVEILRRSFSDESILSEYKSIQLTKYYGDWDDRLRTHEIRVNKRITFLEAIVQRVRKNLIPERGESLAPEGPSPLPSDKQNMIFVIHGHDEASKSQVARLIERLGLTPIILAEKPNRGRTLIEKIERHSDVAFAVAILTPDDLVADKSARARQNVIWELGHFEGKLGRDRICLLLAPGVEIPSDLRGIAYYELDKGDAWQYKLAKEFRDAGFSVDLNKV